MTTDFAKINALGNWKRLVSMFKRKYAIGINRAFNDVIQETATHSEEQFHFCA